MNEKLVRDVETILEGVTFTNTLSGSNTITGGKLDEVLSALHVALEDQEEMDEFIKWLYRLFDSNQASPRTFRDICRFLLEQLSDVQGDNADQLRTAIEVTTGPLVE